MWLERKYVLQLLTSMGFVIRNRKEPAADMEIEDIYILMKQDNRILAENL